MSLSDRMTEARRNSKLDKAVRDLKRESTPERISRLRADITPAK